MKLVSIKPETSEFAHAFAIGKNTTTSILHLLGGAASRCGSSKKNKNVSLSEVETANVSRFCEKCFPNGKPEQFFEITV